MIKNKRFRILKYDLCEGIRHNWWKYALGIMPFIAVWLQASDRISRSYAGTDSPSVIDCLLYLFKGIQFYVPARGSKFEIPLIWVIIQVFVSILIYSYPKEDFEKYGSQILIRTQSKRKWWFSKCIWTVVSVGLYYVLGYVSVIILCGFSGGLLFTPDNVWNLKVNGIDTSSITSFELCIIVLLIPVLTSIALAVLQMTLSFMFSPIYGYVFVISYIVISVYYHNVCFIGANSMILRNQFVTAGGMPPEEIVIVDLFIFLAAGVTGYWRFYKMDVICKQ